MNVTDYRTASNLREDRPDVVADAAIFRVTEYLYGEAAALRRIGEHRMAWVNRWNELKAAEDTRRLSELRARKR
jgi:hypothetical protein